MATRSDSIPPFTAASTGHGDGAVPTAGRDRRIVVFGWLAFASLIATQIVAILMSPPDRMMGHTQKIMYIHVPTAWGAFAAFTVVFIFSVLYLWKRQPRHDDVALAAAEVGTAFTAVTLAQGSIWGRPTWGIWWTWDPRLTTTAILLLIFAGYLALRAFTDDPDRRARWAAAVGIFGFINVPIVFMSVRWWRTLHQVQSTGESVAGVYKLGLLMNVVTFTAVMVYFILRRVHAARVERLAESRHEARMVGGI
jgi:heme exporter protein C